MLSKLMLVPLAIAGALSTPVQAQDVWFVTATYEKPQQLETIAAQFQHVIVDRENRTVSVEADSDAIRRLRAAGFVVTIDHAITDRLRRDDAAWSGGRKLDGFPGFACYRGVADIETALGRIAAQKPGLADVIEIGPSWEKTRDPATGYSLKVLRLGNKATDAALPDKANMVVFSAIHAREYTTAETMTRFAEWLVNGYGSDAEATWLMDHFKFHLLLQANPDGRLKAELNWRKNTNTTNGSCAATKYGVDLNRNFPFLWNNSPGGSSGDPCNDVYRGPVRVSEPETQAMLRYVAGTLGGDGQYRGGVLPDRRAEDFNSAAPADYKGMFFDIHSYSRLVLWPWGGRGGPPPNDAALRTLGRRIAWFNGYKPQQSIMLYANDGSTIDTMYGALGAPSYTIELGLKFLEDCPVYEQTTLPQNLAALRYAARSLQAPYVLPAGPDTRTVSVAPASVAAGTPVTVSATVDDAGVSQINGAEAVQAIASAAAYVDAAPWSAGARPIAMSASDGSFSDTAEAVQVTISTAGLAPGLHRVFVQGTDASGAPGTPNAAQFVVTGSSSNQPPVASFSVATNALVANFTDTSSDSDGTIASRRWNFGDNTSSSATNPSHVYAAAGSYTAALTVTDNAGATHTAARPVVVSGGTAAQTYANTNDYAITDNATVESPIVVSGRSGNAPANASVTVEIFHSYQGDLKVDLVAPDGSLYSIHNRTGQGANDVRKTVTLNLASEALNGIWKLRVNDNAGGDAGHVDRWSIRF